MVKLITSLVLCIFSLNAIGQEDYILETRFRNPIDTAKFHETATMLLFVHSNCQHRHLCPTTRMQRALETDSLGFLNRYGIQLFVIYPRYSDYDIKTFDSFSPKRNANVAFYTSHSYKGAFKEGVSTPYVVFYDGKGHVRTKAGGTIAELNDSVCTKWRFVDIQYPVCHGTGRVSPNRPSNDPDLSVGICRMCTEGIIEKKHFFNSKPYDNKEISRSSDTRGAH